jgi:tetratricopeptide (TPR) repeat protein
MALGFGFNKQKVLAAAEKFVQQGKLQNAITEYEKIAKEDPKDLTVLNTIGDLSARVGNNDKATVYFKRVGDTYATEGFTVKAIAVYKKIAKLAPNATENIVKLAELYTQQGLYNDARAQYVAVADQYLKSNEQEAAARMFQKILELDPENTGMQGKLADLYIKLGKRDEARNIFLTAAQSLYLKGALDAADESLRRVLSLDPGNIDATLLRGKIATDSGDSANAVALLEKIPNLDSRPDALRALLTAHITARKFDAATPLATKLANVHNDTSGASSLAEGLMAAEQYDKALAVYTEFADRLIAGNPKGLMDTLHASINRIKENARALELLLGLYRKAGDTTNINEVTELLAHAYVQSNELPKAAALYKQLSELEPENALHAQNYKQIQSRMGQDAAQRPLTREEGGQALMIEEMEIEHAVPGIEQKYPASA